MKKTVLLLMLSVCLSIAALPSRDSLAAAAAGVAGRTVTISNFQFAPQTVTIRAGGTVMWSNNEGTHTVTADDDSWASQTLHAGQTFSHQFTKPGTYGYHCSLHGSPHGDMYGVVKVLR
ncbi:MAG: cupredoxin domain-containing protein [Acidobacteriota bacterium]|nr:cupredoxin domain-containing protein [Acidobacteriota bacterium]